MRKFTNIAVCIASMSLLTASSWAQQCASIQFHTAKTASEHMLMEPVAVDGEYQNVDKHYRALVNDEYQIYLAPGVHSLGVKFWSKSQFMARINKLRSTKVIEVVTPKEEHQEVKQLSLMVSKNYKYIVGIEKNSDSYHVVLKDKIPFDCGAEQQLIYNTPVPYTSAQPDSFVNQKLSNIVKAAYQYTDRNAYANSVHFAEVFGSSTQFDHNSNSLIVNNVIGSSFADQLGVKIGDKLVAFGDVQQHKVNKEAFNAYLASLEFGKEVAIVVERNGQLLTFNQTYLPVAVPEYSFNFVSTADEAHGFIENAGKLRDKVNAYFDAQMLELSKHLIDSGYQGEVHFNVPLKGQDSKFHLLLSLTSREKMEQIVANNARDFDEFSENPSRWDRNSYRELMKLPLNGRIDDNAKHIPKVNNNNKNNN